MPKLKRSEWDPLSNGVYRVTTPKKSYLAVSRARGLAWFSEKLLGLAKEKDGYLFFPDPQVSAIAIFSSEEFARAAYPDLAPGEVRRVRSNARENIAETYGSPSLYLNPPAPQELTFSP